MEVHFMDDKAKILAIHAIVRKHTQYENTLDPHALLQEDLGVDSIMLASIVAELKTFFQVKETPSLDGLDTLALLLQRFGLDVDTSADGSSPSTATPISPPSGPQPSTMRDFSGTLDRDLFAKTHRFAKFLGQREQQGQFWYGMASHGMCTNRARIFDRYEGREREFLLFASNNYLGLANDPRVIETIVQATRAYGATNTGSRLIGGTTDLHLTLERRLARLKGRDDCIVFPSGYSANLGAISALAGLHDLVATDVYNHMSILDGCKLSGAARKIYAHNDMESLEEVLRRNEALPGGRLIVADGVFSMHGDVARLPEILRLADQYGAKVMVDDAHATGVLGATGSGTAEHFGLKGQVHLEAGTMSKALGGQGGFVAGDQDVIDYLRFYANSYVFAATIPAPVVAGLIASLDILEAEPERRQRLWQNISYLKTSLDGLGFDTGESDSAIIPIALGDETVAMAMGRSVRQRGMFCQTVVFPGVAVGDARLRLSVLESHERADLDTAIQILVDSAHENNLRLG